MPEPARTRQQEILSILLSLVIGSILWLYVDSRRTVSKDADAQVVLTIPEGWEWVDSPPDKIALRVQGARTRMDLLDLSRITLRRDIVPPQDAADTAVQEPVRPGDFELPEGVTVVDLRQTELRGRMVRLVPSLVRVQPDIEGKPMEGYMVAQARIAPRFVRVMVPPDFDVSQVQMFTSPTIRLDGTETENAFFQVSVRPQTVGKRVLTSTARLDVTLLIQPVPKQQEFPGAKVRVLYGPQLGLRIANITPPVVSVTLRGGQREIDALAKDGPLVYVDLAELTGKAAGEHLFPCRVQARPGIEVVQITPPEVQLVLE